MKRIRKGKVLKYKMGYNPNCSSGMWVLGYMFYGFIGGIVLVIVSVTLAVIFYQRHGSKSEKHETSEI